MKPFFRPRRLRENPILRRMVRETRLSVDQLIYPVFVVEGEGIREEISSMPGQFRYSQDTLIEELGQVQEIGVPAVILFGIPEADKKDARGTAGYARDGVICQALEKASKEVPDLLLIADVCLCEYTDHGHCGIVDHQAGSDQAPVQNDETLELLALTAVAYAEAGAHLVAPSDMMDGRVAAIREALDQERREDVPILSYAAKYASGFYGPFRDAAESIPQFGDRRSYQMDPANSREALKEVDLDLDEGADIVMVKPAMPYLDVIFQVRQLTTVPVAAFQVSGEYSALCAAFAQGWLQRERVLAESLLAIRRAGADLILTYFAKEAARMIRKGDL
ncbi:MAG: porphobilinogen synthase [Acidobacteriota bacterium]|nr:porphobilinogen synthase [Acidobacteriota bacterium]